jgi:hypothetical protein
MARVYSREPLNLFLDAGRRKGSSPLGWIGFAMLTEGTAKGTASLSLPAKELLSLESATEKRGREFVEVGDSRESQARLPRVVYPLDGGTEFGGQESWARASSAYPLMKMSP